MKKYYVLGNPIEHSMSPIIHRMFAKQLDRNISYDRVKVAVDNFQTQLKQLLSSGMSGCNITVPFKGVAWEFADNLSPSAAMAEAVNTIVCENDGTITGHNTDGVGLVNDLFCNYNLPLNNKKILIAGAGGAARGILQPLLQRHPAHISISNRTHEKAQYLAQKFSHLGPVYAIRYHRLSDQSFDLIINATSLSLDAAVPPIPDCCIDSNTTLYDLMYANELTSFQLWGKQLGALKTIDGLGMLVEQAAESFFLWQNSRPDTQSVIEHLKKK